VDRRDDHNLRIAIASGKGGTGKTTLATNLAVTLADHGRPVAYLDCDVEEPNGHIFLKPVIEQGRRVSIPVPAVDEARCNFCGACAEACRYSAILVLNKKILLFPNLCHGCGGCTLACPEDAITEVPREIGGLEQGMAEGVVFVHGRLDVGEAMSPPVIRAVLDAGPDDHTLVLDAPPGTSCPVVESVKGSDVVLLVTEPTPFGLNDLKLAVEMVRTLGLPFAVAVNRVGIGDRGVFDYCEREGIVILLELPDDRRIAEAYSRGELAIRALPELRPLFIDLVAGLAKLARGPRPRVVPRAKPAPQPAELPPTPSETMPPERTTAIRELVVISGKGGTGKTSVVASFIALAGGTVAVDCDVDAADLHLVLDPTVRARWPFSGGDEARIDPSACTGCGLCLEPCRFDAIRLKPIGAEQVCEIDAVSCEGCGVCVDVCPEGAIEMVPSANGEWFVSDTRHGVLVHARLGIAQENSGKLVFLVRREGRAVAGLEQADLLIADGSPGIGCPVIASITGARMALVVTEPTLSGLHDMRRVAELTRHFGVATSVCINKADINSELADRLEREARELGLAVLGRIPFDPAVTHAQVRGRSVVEYGDSPAAREIRLIWERVSHAIN